MCFAADLALQRFNEGYLLLAFFVDWSANGKISILPTRKGFSRCLKLSTSKSVKQCVAELKAA